MLVEHSGDRARELPAAIRLDAAWLTVEPLDMCVVIDTALARVVQVFGTAHPHHVYVFANKSATRIKVPVYDGFGLWRAASRLNRGRFVWADAVGLNADQLGAPVGALPWKTVVHHRVIAVV